MADGDGAAFRAISWDSSLIVQPSLEAALAAIRAGLPTWVDLTGRNADAERFLGETGLDLHPLVIEDIFSDTQRPKAEELGDYLYVCVHAPMTSATDSGALDLSEIDLVAGESYCVTHHHEPSAAIQSVFDDVKRNGGMLRKGANHVMHAVLDRLVDDYMPVMDGLDEEVEGLENLVLSEGGATSPEVLPRIFGCKRKLQALRRMAVHQKEVLHRLGRGDFQRIPDTLVPFYRDVFDHFVRVADLGESYRDVISAALEAYLSVQSNRMNAIMKTLTLTATCFLPLSFVAGFYGMNFEHMPELHARWGYPAVILVMVGVVVFMLTLYRRKRWI